MPKRLAQKDVEQRFNEKGLVLLSQYTDAHGMVQVRCSCGRSFATKPMRVFNGDTTSCGCFRRDSGKKRQIPVREVEQRFSKKGLTLLSEYRGGKNKVKIRCRCGEVFESRPADVFSGLTVSCGCANRLPHEEAKQRFERNNLKLLSTYLHSRKTVSVQCHCGNVFLTMPQSVFAGSTTSCGCIKKVSEEYVFAHFKEKGLTIVSPYRKTSSKVHVRCYCGKVFLTTPSDVLRGATRSCGCYQRKRASETSRKDIANRRFGSLVAIDPSHTDRWQTVYWKCQCDCGQYVTVAINNLTGGNTTSCGCLKRRRAGNSPNWRGCGKIPGTHWSDIKISARRRHISFDLTVDYCWQLFVNQQECCALSGVELCFGSRKYKDDITASLDRVDNNLPYAIGNVQWVHKIVNGMKGSLDEKRFIEMCVLVVHSIMSETRGQACEVGLKGNKYKGCGNISGLHWLRIQRNASKRDIIFDISVQDAWNIFMAQQGKCALTGLDLDWDVLSMLSFKRHRGSASLDRIDSKKGYQIGNIQWVHKEVNLMKWDLDETDFRKWCQLVAQHQLRKTMKLH